MNAGRQGHALRERPRDRRLRATALPVQTGASRAGNDCDAFAPRWSRARMAPRETVVDAKRGRSSGRLRKRGDFWRIAVALARPEIAVRRIYCRKAAGNEAAGGLDGKSLPLVHGGQLRAMLARGPPGGNCRAWG